MSNVYQRNILPYLLELLEQFPIIAILGARQTGKTTLAKQAGTNWLYMDLERESHYERLLADPEFFFQQNPERVIFDEAQLLPKLFTTLRSIIDENRTQKGRFIITGSSSPALLKNISESLAGRIAILELNTLKANEYFHQPLSEFYQIFHSKLNKKNVTILKPQLSSKQIQQFWFKGGYPEPIAHDDEFYREWMSDYQATYINRDLANLFPKLDKVAYRRFISMLAKLSSKIINKSDIARSVAVSQPTISDYLDIAAGTFIWRKLPSFDLNINKTIVKMPRGHIRDSGFLHYLLHIADLPSLQDDPIAGFSFEAFVIEELLKGLQDARLRNVDSYYFRTRDGAEIDLILQSQFGILPIEIKYGVHTPRKQLISLTNFIKDNKLKFGIVINQANEMLWLTEHILQVPAGCL